MRDCHASPDLAALLETGFELPPPTVSELGALRESITAHGILDPAVVSTGPAKPGEVADGRARIAVCAALGIDCPRAEHPFATEAEFDLYRLSTNILRRELPVAQRIRFGLLLEPRERDNAAKRRAQAPGKPHGTKALPVELSEQQGETRQLVAALVGLKPSTYERGAKVVREGTPELVARLDAGLETVNSAYRKLRAEQQRADKRALAEQIAASPPRLPAGRYPVLAIDPPWPYENLPYPVMSLEEIAALPIPDLLTDDAIVWLWTTNRFLEDAMAIANQHWRLVKRNLLTWDKQRVGNGQWLLGQTEHCLLLTHGNPVFTQGNATTLIRERAREHSRKPEAFYTLVERTCPGQKLELFARERRPNWHAWGAEPDHFPTQPTNDQP